MEPLPLKCCDGHCLQASPQVAERSPSQGCQRRLLTAPLPPLSGQLEPPLTSMHSATLIMSCQHGCCF